MIYIIQLNFLSLILEGANMENKSNKIKIIMILLFLSIFLIVTVVNSEENSTIVSIDDIDISDSGSNWCLLKINNVSNLGSCDIVLTWDPNVITVTDVGNSDFDFLEYYVNESAGTLSIIAFSYEELNGDYTIAMVTFTPAAGASASNESNLMITESLFLTAEPLPSDINHFEHARLILT